MKRLILLLLAAFYGLTAAAQRPYGGLFEGKPDLETAASEFITLRRAEGRVWFEIPTRYMGRRMLLASTLTEISDGRMGDVGHRKEDPLHFRFSVVDSTLFMHFVNTEQTTEYARAALARLNIDPIFTSFPIVARGPESGPGGRSVVVEMTDFLLDSPSWSNFFPTILGEVTATFNRESSRMETIKAFEDNVSVSSTLSFTVTAGEIADNQPVTARVTRSILLLPERGMMPRISDSRVGVFSTEKMRFASARQGSQTYSVANRWRMVPSDPAAYARGELVEPVKKIVWYIDPAFPESWKEPLRRAVENWNAPFEAIGFRNVMQAIPFPTPEQDPAFDPDNIKYSCIRFLPSNTINAMGPSWVDPSTGEVIAASVIVWSDVVKLATRWRFVQTSQVDERVRGKELPADIFAESLEYIISHEVGHTLGFAHSMAASHAWPVDSLRSPAFTQKFGTTPSIMDYARFNYVAQPGDVGVRLTPPKIGVADYFTVKWTYQWVPGMADEWEEAPIVEGWVDAHAGDPVYRYGRQQLNAMYDPSAINEDLGDDAIRASDYGIANLRFILPQMAGWVTGDPDYELRREFYDELTLQFSRYINAVMMNIGGIYLTEVKEGTPGRHIEPVPHALQKASLRWVMDHLRDMDWLDEPSLLPHFALGTTGSAQLRSQALDGLVGKIPNVILSSHYSRMEASGTRRSARIEARQEAHTTRGADAYTIEEFMEDLYHETWKNVRHHMRRHSPLPFAERVLHSAMVDLFCTPLTAMGGGGQTTAIVGLAGAGLAGDRSDPGTSFGPPGMNLQDPVDVAVWDDSNRWLIEMAMRSRHMLQTAVVRSRGANRAHYQELLARLNVAFKDKL